MRLIDRILGRGRAKKADKAADKGSDVPGGVGDASRGWKLLRRGDKKADEERKKRKK